MTKAIIIDRTGGPETLQWKDVEVGKPSGGQVRVRQIAVGLNYIDVYQRSGLYPVPLPGSIGLEAAGVVEEVGAGISDLKLVTALPMPAVLLGLTRKHA